MTKKIAAIICGVSWVLGTIFTFTPARGALPPEPTFIIGVAFLLIALISIGILIGLAVGDHYRRPR